MKKQKLTPEEKKELKAMKKAWNEMIRRAKKKGAWIEETSKCNNE